LKVTPTGSKVYLIQYRLGGRQARTQRCTIGKHGSPWTPEKAREQAEALLGQVANKLDPAKRKKAAVAAHQADAEAPTFAEFAARYIEEHARPYKKPRTIEEDERNLRLHILPGFGRLKIKDITSAEITKFHAARSHSPVNANRCRALLSHIFEKAEAWGERRPESNPCRYVEKYREHKRERFLSAEEFVRFADALARAEAEEPPSAVAAIRLLILTGCRKSEILKLRWAWVDFERGCLVLPDSIRQNVAKTTSISKSGPKIVPLGAAGVRLLSELPRQEGSPYVLPAERGNGHFVGVQKVWQRIRSAAGLEDVRIHDLRHTFASTAVSEGESLYLLSKVLGHSDVKTTQRYAHVANDPLRGVADRTSEKISAMIWNGNGVSNVVPLPSSNRANKAAG
jgi:integrase